MAEKSAVALAREEASALWLEYAWWKTLHTDLSDYFQPWRHRALATDANKPKRNSKNARNKALMCVRVGRAGLMGGLTPQSQPWFELTTADPDLAKNRRVKEWLYDVKLILLEVYARTNIYDALHESYGDDLTFGVSSVMIDDDTKDLIRGYVEPVGSFVLQNSERLQVDTRFKRMTMTVRQLVRKFGLEACSPPVQEAHRRHQHHIKHEVMHAVRPRMDRERGYRDAKNMPWSSCWYEVAGDPDKALLESGYNEFPLLCPRWDKVGEDVYGRPPSVDCLGAAKGLQKFEERRLQALDKLVNPPMNAPRDLKNEGGTTLLPGETNYYDGGQHSRVEPAFMVDPRIFVEARNEIADIEDQIEEAMFYDLFLLIARDERSGVTAEEIRAEKEERLLQVGPTVQRMEREKLSPLIFRSLAVLERRGELPPPPPDMEGSMLSIEFVGPLSVAQKAVATSSLERAMSFATNLSKFIPNVLDKVDGDESVDNYFKSIGAPPKTLRDEDTVKKIRADREAEDQAQKMAAMAKPASDMANAIKTGAETQPVEGNPLSRLAAALPQPPASAPPSAVLPPGLSAVPGNAA